MIDLSTDSSPQAPNNRSRVLINTIPKAGTHLLEKVVRLLPGYDPSGQHINQFLPADTLLQSRSGEADNAFAEVPLDHLEADILAIPLGQYATAHLLYSDSIAVALQAWNIVLLSIVRDPRDIAISFVKYVAGLESHYLFPAYQRLSFDEQLMTTIVGIPTPLSKYVPYIPTLMDIGAMVAAFLPWSRQRNVYTTTFEKLVGSQGGGSQREQAIELRNIARHIGLDCTEAELAQVAEHIFGGSATFRKGTIGDWRNHFSPEHRAAFKQVAGQLLIDLGYETDPNW